MTLFNIIFFALIWRVIGGMFTNDKGENAVSRWVSLTAVLIIIASQAPDLFHLAAYCYLFCILRLLATRPLLDTTHGDKKSILRSFYRNLPIVIALPFTNWWYAVFLLQGGLYYVIGRIRTRYPVFNPIAISEIVSGFIYGLLLPIR